MAVYDTDDAVQAARLLERIDTDGLLEANLVSTFGPDTAEEAANRGFRPVD